MPRACEARPRSRAGPLQALGLQGLHTTWHSVHRQQRERPNRQGGAPRCQAPLGSLGAREPEAREREAARRRHHKVALQVAALDEHGPSPWAHHPSSIAPLLPARAWWAAACLRRTGACCRLHEPRAGHEWAQGRVVGRCWGCAGVRWCFRYGTKCCDAGAGSGCRSPGYAAMRQSRTSLAWSCFRLRNTRQVHGRVVGHCLGCRAFVCASAFARISQAL